MNKELAKQLLLFVNTPGNLETLQLYLNWRIEAQRDALEENSVSSHFHQGALRELRRFSTLREDVIKAWGK